MVLDPTPLPHLDLSLVVYIETISTVTEQIVLSVNWSFKQPRQTHITTTRTTHNQHLLSCRAQPPVLFGLGAARKEDEDDDHDDDDDDGTGWLAALLAPR